MGMSDEESMAFEYYPLAPDANASLHQAQQSWQDHQSDRMGLYGAVLALSNGIFSLLVAKV
jgi:hypothetical protein